MSASGLSPAQLERLRAFDTPTICNVIELFAMQPRTAGYMDKRIQACFAELPPMVGYAATATFRSAGPAPGDGYASIEQQIETFGDAPGAPVVVFQDIDDPVVAATFGEVMCTTYQAFGAQGIITSGAGRDLAQVRALGFPAFTNGTICSHGYNRTLTLQVSVHIGGLLVYPGDLLHGDCNGVTTIPHAIAAQVADACAAFVDAESVVLTYLHQPGPSSAGLREARAEYKRRIDVLSTQIHGGGAR
jgi:4-hydroxy-4-methyl-2-oxoglutarate aldolase